MIKPPNWDDTYDLNDATDFFTLKDAAQKNFLYLFRYVEEMVKEHNMLIRGLIKHEDMRPWYHELLEEKDPNA